MPRRSPVWLLWLALAAPLFGASPPEELFFGIAGIERRVAFSPAPRHRSGDYLFELVEVDTLPGESEGLLRLIVRCTAAGATPLPADLVVLGDVYAADREGRSLPVRSYGALRSGDAAWLTITVAGSETSELSAVAASAGPRPAEVERVERLGLDRLGQTVALPQVGWSVDLTLLRREEAELDVTPEGPPYYYSLDSTLGRQADASVSGGASSFLTLRLHTLAGAESDDGWRLANLRLAADRGQVIDDWRYIRRPWRPDWGGWLGVIGHDWSAEASGPERPTRGVRVESTTPGGPAAQAGLRRGDVIAALDGDRVADAYSLGEVVRSRPGGGKVRLEVWRDGARLDVTAALGGKSLWPNLDDVEFEQAWQRLVTVAGSGNEARRPVLSQWEWQSRSPVAEGFEATSLDLVFRRVAPAEGTTFLFRSVPLERAQ